MWWLRLRSLKGLSDLSFGFVGLWAICFGGLHFITLQKQLPNSVPQGGEAYHPAPTPKQLEELHQPQTLTY